MQSSLTIPLADEAATLALGRAFGQALAGARGRTTILLRGELGAGKTTFARGLVSALPGAADAEVSSPSFTLVNVYPTDPAVVHVDFYRLEEEGSSTASALGIIEECLEELPGRAVAVLVEWPQRVPVDRWPAQRVELELRHAPCGRLAGVRWGPGAGALATEACGIFEQALSKQG